MNDVSWDFVLLVSLVSPRSGNRLDHEPFRVRFGNHTNGLCLTVVIALDSLIRVVAMPGCGVPVNLDPFVRSNIVSFVRSERVSLLP